MAQTITLNEREAPPEKSREGDLDWVCDSLGLAAARDTQRISPKVLRVVIDHREGITSEEIAQELRIETQRVLYHLRSLINAGMLVRRKRRIFLRHESVVGAIRAVRGDIDRIFGELLTVAADIDDESGRKSR